MPIYVKDCEECGEVTEQFARTFAQELRECPHCGGQLKNQIFSPALFMGKAPFCFRWKFTNPYNDGKKP